MPATTTRTLNPLPFTDLEPKRFEDLVRQLVYDFKPWRRLEATGRAGSDDGFDARGLEIVETEAPVPDDEAEGEEVESATASADRLWLIQCKRERTITPAKLAGYLDEIKLGSDEALHGIIFAAACDFSKKARDAFLTWCHEHGINEGHLWGKGELEDQLYQPKNDNLLFAYFGISLTIRKRSQATQIRAEIATKRKLQKHVLKSSADVLLRDPAADDYPHSKAGKPPTQWQTYQPEELSHYGLRLKVVWFHAFIDEAKREWDCADAVRVVHRHDYWAIEPSAEEKKRDHEAGEIWHALPEENKAWLMVSGYVPLRNIIAIDDMGDDVFSGVHIYVPFSGESGPFDGYFIRVEPIGRSAFARRTHDPDALTRIDVFPAHLKRKR